MDRGTNKGPEVAAAPTNGNAKTGFTFARYDGHYVEVGADQDPSHPAHGSPLTLSFNVALPSNPCVYALLNTFYGQVGQTNATVVFANSRGQTISFTLVGDQTIRDYNQNNFTNDLAGYNLAAGQSGLFTQNWWNNAADADGNGHQRLDVTTFILPSSWAGTALVSMTITNPYASSGYTDAVLLSALQVDDAVNFSPFFNGEVALSNGVYYLAFPENGNVFGYYGFLTDPHYVYHFDLGYEYVFDAADGNAGVYLYDFASSHFFYTSPTFPFPYLYDFSLNSVLYYYPDPNNPGRYNTNGARYFYDFATGQIITQ